MNENYWNIEHYNAVEFLKEVAKLIYENKVEFDGYAKDNKKLAAVKRIKELTGGGLKESKDAYELWLNGKLPNYLLEDRRVKLERLAKKPLVDELIVKLKNLDEEKLNSILMKMSVDNLLTIDEYFTEIE